MCGIYGFTGQPNLELIKKIAKASKSRGPDRQSTYVGKAISLAHNHLFIQESDPKKVVTQPYETSSGNVLLWNGEIYGAIGSDTEWLGHMLDNYGADSLVGRSGMWAIAYLDKQKKELHLIRDHFGTKPLYYTVVDNQLVFASTLKSLAVYPGVSFEPDDEMIEIGLAFGRFVPGPRTEFKHIHKIAPGEHKIWSLDQQKFIKSSSMLFMPHGGVIDEEYDPEYMKTMFMHCFREGAASPQKTGLFYSGGLDSTTLLLSLAGLNNLDLTCFTTYADPYEYDNKVLTRAMTLKYNTPQVEMEMSEKTYIEHIARKHPSFLDIHGTQIQDRRRSVPRIIMNHMAAKNGCKVVLNGDGADELLVLRDAIKGGSSSRFGVVRRRIGSNIVDYMLSWLPLSLFCNCSVTNARVMDTIGLGEMYNTFSDSIAGFFSMESRPLFFHQALAFRLMFMKPELRPCYVIPKWEEIWPNTLPKHILTKAFEKELSMHQHLFSKKVGWAIDKPHRIKTQDYKDTQKRKYDLYYKESVYDFQKNFV